MNAINKVFTTSDNTHLMCYIWEDVQNPIGVVQIIHGIFENISTYDKLARFLNTNGYIVFGVDKSLSKIPQTFERAIAQENDIMQYLAKKYSLPIFLIGYGYGGFIAQSILQKTETPPAAVCLIKAYRHSRLAMKCARTIAKIGAFICGSNANVRLITQLSRNHCGRRQHSPLCTYGFCVSLFDGLAKLDTNIRFKNPTMIISNASESDAPVAQFSRTLYDAYCNNDLNRMTLMIYPDMKNKLLLEMNCGAIQGDILSFFNDTNLHHHSDTLASENGTIFCKSTSDI